MEIFRFIIQFGGVKYNCVIAFKYQGRFIYKIKLSTKNLPVKDDIYLVGEGCNPNVAVWTK